MGDAFRDPGSTQKPCPVATLPPVLCPVPAVASWLPSPPPGRIALPAPFPGSSEAAKCSQDIPTAKAKRLGLAEPSLRGHGLAGERTDSPLGRLWPSLEPAQLPSPILANEIEFYDGLVSAEFFHSFFLQRFIGYWLYARPLEVLRWTRQEVASPS